MSLFQTTHSPAPEIGVDDLDALLRADAAVVLDVREEMEVRRGHVPGALHVPLGFLHGRMASLPHDRRLAVICQSGNRSRTATEMLIRAGFADAVSVAGGTNAWIRSGRTVTLGAADAA